MRRRCCAKQGAESRVGGRYPGNVSWVRACHGQELLQTCLSSYQLLQLGQMQLLHPTVGEALGSGITYLGWG